MQCCLFVCKLIIINSSILGWFHCFSNEQKNRNKKSIDIFNFFSLLLLFLFTFHHHHHTHKRHYEWSFCFFSCRKCLLIIMMMLMIREPRKSYWLLAYNWNRKQTFFFHRKKELKKINQNFLFLFFRWKILIFFISGEKKWNSWWP